MQKINVITWASLLICSMYDDILIVDCLTTKNLLAHKLGISSKLLYNATIIYSLGFLIGTTFWNVLIKCFSVKYLFRISQVILLLASISLIFSNSLTQVFVVRLVQGIMSSCAIVCLIPLIKKTFTPENFDRFIMFNSIVFYVVESIVPLVKSYLNSISIKYSIGFIVAIIILSLYTFFIRIKDINEKKNAIEAIRDTVSNYVDILMSPLVILLGISAITEGVSEALINALQGIIENVWPHFPNRVFSISLSFVSAILSISIHIISYFGAKSEKNTSNNLFNWSSSSLKVDRKIIMIVSEFTLILLLATGVMLNIKSYIIFILFLTMILIALAIIQYSILKILYNVYSNAACVVSILAIIETLGSIIIQISSSFLQDFNNIHYVFAYSFICFIVIVFLIFYFRFLTKKLVR